MTSPTQRSLAHLKDLGYMAKVVEHWNAFAKRRMDLWNGDILAVKGKETLLVQTTTMSNVSARVAKILAAPETAVLLAAGWSIHVHGWRKLAKSGKWEVRVTDIQGVICIS